MKFTPVSPELLVSRLQKPPKGCRVVLDTDTYNEIDDPYALVYALCSPEIKLEAVYAAPFHNDRSAGPEDGMERSYAQILEILQLLEMDLPVYKGSRRWMTSPDDAVDSPAVRDLIQRALSSDEPLYVATIGAPTNVASAILMEPKIREKIVVVWLGGHGLHFPKTDEFNMKQDLFASQILLDSGVPLVLLPCAGVISHLLITIPELERELAEKGKCGQYLLEITREYMKQHPCHSKVIWDIATIGWICNSDWFQSGLIPSPILTPSFTYSTDVQRHFIRYVNFCNRDAIFSDLYAKM
ncbi:MAG: nucleoside hydrolase [Candidatus Merdivicinus sp.]